MEIECGAADKATAPFTADWSSAQRQALETAMKQGVVAVRYGCDEIELLPACGLPGEYAFVPIARGKKTWSVATLDELAGTLPMGAKRLASEVAEDASIDLTIAASGKLSSTWAGPLRSDLPAGCDEATHVVRAATIGAFSLSRGTETLAGEGDLDACPHSFVDDAPAPEGCGATVRIELVPIREQLNSAVAWGRLEVLACPSGVHHAGICKSAAVPYVCDPNDEDQCAEQCDAGNLESCFYLGDLLLDRLDPPPSRPRKDARPLIERACHGGVVDACVALGGLTLANDRRTPTTALAASRHWDAACKVGNGTGCSRLADLSSGQGAMPDPAAHTSWAQRACDLGDSRGCTLLAGAKIQGNETQADPEGGYAALERACQGRDSDAVTACQRLAVARYAGFDPWIPASRRPVDKEAGIRFGLRECRLFADMMCGAGWEIEDVDEALAKQFRDDLCSAGHERSCG